ncbi:MAG TPA: penicillin-binding protein [Cytophagaceae bacterium]|nr:penicillin-binding protein [Cytophagaceae bacterium]
MNIKSAILLRIRIAFLFLVLFSFAIIWRIVKVQQIEGERWKKLAHENLLQYSTVKATRGNIYSDNGSLLATSIPFYRLCFDPTIADTEVFRKGVDSLAIQLSHFYKDKSREEYKRILKDARRSGKEYLVINKALINFQGKKTMSEWPIFREGRSKGGVVFEKIDKRFRPFSSLAMRTIGFVNENNKGAGLEYTFNNQLAGRNGQALFRRMSGGILKPMHDESEVRPIDGIDIQTTINVNIQDVAEASLRKHLAKHDADYGCVVLMEVKTGEIKALANMGKIAPGVYAENYNYAVGNQGLTDPGSTFKLVSMISLIEESGMQLEDTVNTGKGEYKFYDRIMRDHKPDGYGVITMQEAFEKSSNIAISKKVQQVFGTKPEAFIGYVRRLGMADPLGFQMEGTAKPRIKTPTSKSWSGITLPWMSIGYELEVTPLQTLALYNAVANDGKMIRPIIVKSTKVVDHNIDEFETEVLIEKICGDKTLNMLRTVLEGVVENGTAINIKNNNYKIAGKTGTAQKLKDKTYTRTYYTSFVGYFPADAPKYSCIVVIDNPKGFEQYGSDVAAPVFKEIADKIFSTDLDLHKMVDLKQKQNNTTLPVIRGGNFEELKALCNDYKIANHTKGEINEEWVSSRAENSSVMWVPRTTAKDKLPDVVGYRLRDALFILENKGLHVKVSGEGRVVRQIPASNSPLVGVSTVLLELR